MNGTTSNISLKKMARHSSLLVCYASGIGCDALLETVHNKSRGEERKERAKEDGEREGGEGKEGTKAKTKIDSFKLSADVKLPIVQLAVCALVLEEGEERAKRSTLPSLSQAQSQLNFQLSNLSQQRVERPGQRRSVFYWRQGLGNLRQLVSQR